MKYFDTIEKELGEKRGVISALDFANEVVAITTAAIKVMSLTQSREFATTVAAMKIAEDLDKLFPEESRHEEEDKAAEEPQEEKNTEEKPVDLKLMLFNHAADSREPIPGMDIENNRTAEIRRDAKHTALISLILNAGLGGEYREWLRKRYE